MPWNTGDHGRKFLLSEATYFDGHDWRSDTVAFWGEWEPQSTIQEMLPTGPGLPQAVQRPHWSVPAHLTRRQNTDPLVFGEHFAYTNCRQNQNTKLRSLTPGSVMLFGSKVAHRFVLDTVFVVASRASYRPLTGIDGPDYLEPLVTGPLSGSEKWGNYQFQAYRGATPKTRIAGMYSFAPCTPHVPGSPGFARPTLDLGNLLNDNLAMAARTTSMAIGQASAVWQRVVGPGVGRRARPRHRIPLPPNTESLGPYSSRGAASALSV